MAVLGLALISGCATSRDVRTLQVQLDEMRATQSSMTNALARLDSLSRTERGGTHELVVSLKHSVSDFENRLFQIDSRINDFDQRMGNSAQESPRVLSPAVTNTSTDTPGPGPESSGAQRLYQDAFEALNQDNHEVAVAGFREFVAQSPDAPEAASAVYWIGESFFALRSLDSALVQFQTILDRYPDSEKVPAALLKSGNIYTELDDKKSAYPYYKRLKEEFPQSLEYQLLRRSLDE
jgi:tol-pal system protein YbgF